MKTGPEEVGPVAPTPVESGAAPVPAPVEPAGATSSGGKDTAVAAQEALKIVPLLETGWQVPAGTSLDDAYNQFSEKYTPAKVSRIVVKVTDGDAPPHLADWLKSILPSLSAPAGERMAVYTTVERDTATAIIAENCVLQWFARNPADKGFATRSSLIENHLGKVGTARSLPVLQAHLQAQDEQLVAVTKQTLEAVEKRLAE